MADRPTPSMLPRVDLVAASKLASGNEVSLEVVTDLVRMVIANQLAHSANLQLLQASQQELGKRLDMLETESRRRLDTIAEEIHALVEAHRARDAHLDQLTAHLLREDEVLE